MSTSPDDGRTDSGGARGTDTGEPGGAAVDVTVNGEPRRLPAGTTVAGLAAELGLGGRPWAVEIDRCIVPRSQHARRVLAPGEAIEIVHFVGGG